MTNLIESDSVFLQPLDYDNLTDAEQDYVDGLINVASEAIEHECNRTFASTVYSEEAHGGSGHNSVFVFNSPIITLTSVVYVTSTTTTITASDLTYNADTGEIRWKTAGQTLTSTRTFGRVFTEGFNNILINYTGGFATIPYAIQMLTAQLVMEQFDSEVAKNGIVKEKLGQYFVEYNVKKLKDSIMANSSILGDYKIRKVSEGTWP